MNCQQVREQMLDLVSAPNEAERFPDAHQHLAGCADCAQRATELRRTMSLLDEWTAPEPSPFFSARLRARVREEAARPQTLRERLQAFWALPARKLAAATVVAMLLIGGVLMFRGGRDLATPQTRAGVNRGTAVADLQTLDKDEDLYADFDLLDAIPDTDQDATP